MTHDDWDSVSSDTPPDSATDAWEAVSEPQRPPAPARRRLLPDNLVIEGDALQPTHLSGQDTPITLPFEKPQPQQDVVVKPLSQPRPVASKTRGFLTTPAPRKPVPVSLLKRRIELFFLAAFVLVVSGLGVFQGISTHNANVAATATAEATASAASLVPTILSVSQFLSAQNQEITISGNGFGEQAPYTNATSAYLLIEDVTSNWTAGSNGDTVTVNVSIWNDNQIVITGFAGSYGTNGFVFRPGDNVVIVVWNVQSGEGGTGQAQFSLVVSG